ncbi:MAG: hypothetical protein RH946_10595 [Rhodospirillales bacterium]
MKTGFSILPLVFILTACSIQLSAHTRDAREIARAALPDMRTSTGFRDITLFVSENFEPSEGPKTFLEIIDGSFSDWRIKAECEDGRVEMDGCFELVAEYELSIDDWQTDQVASTQGSLCDCGDIDFGPQVSADDWQTLFEARELPTGSPNYLYRINQVVLSLDRKRAIVSLEYYCAGLCGEGYSLLLESETGEWKVIGKQPHWVS